jgi:thioredoxin:protein disulfide reductase
MGSFEQTMADSTLWAFATVFGAGILTSLTPCVYPMIPITIAIFGAKETKSRFSAFLLATAYVMGIAVMYSGLGVAAALSGGWAAGNLLTNPWFVVPLAVFFVVLSTSMFGLWEIRLPFWLQNKMSSVGGKGYWGAFAMGLVGGVLIAPCTGPVLAGILGYVATTKNVIMGAALLFTYALGIGVLFWILATFAVSLPKSGAWMEVVKSILGVALLAAALYFLQNVFVPLAEYSSGGWVFAAINGGLLILGILIGGLHLQFQGALSSVRKIVGVVMICVGAFGLVNFVLAPSAKLPWVYKEAAALTQAKREGKPVFIDFWAISCVPCKVMEAQVLVHPAVRRELDRFVMLKIDADKDLDNDGALKKKYRQTQLPEVIVIDAAGKEVARAGKVETPQAMITLLRRAK